jgi:hypothetical protein
MKKGILVCLAVALAMVGSVSAKSCPEGMVSYWKFDDGEGTIVSDSFGTNDGTLKDGTWTEGLVGGALEFDGIDDYVEVLGTPSLSFQTMSIETWIFVDKTTIDRAILAKRDGFYMYAPYSPSPSSPFGQAYLISINGKHRPYTWSKESLTLGEWHQITGTYDGSQIKLYVDGALKEVVLRPGSIDQNANPLLFGAHSPGRSHFDGLIDEIAVYNRALTSEEIQKHYLNGLKGIGYCETADNNKGHGNDPDGIDEDNPGKGCENKNENGNRKRC